MALCDITRPQLFSVDTAHFRQLFSQFRIEQKAQELTPKPMDAARKPRQIGQLPLMTESDNKKIYFCQRCLNHGYRLPRKNHKCECPYADCKCEYCFLVVKRRQLNSQLHDLDGADTESTKAASGGEDAVTAGGDGESDRMIRVKGVNILNNLIVLPASRSVHYTTVAEGSEGGSGQPVAK
ncbi:hypothetical protein Y032_0269g814 [Ancylostoma ceylanicum]|uniref:DM domain-containing protein n=1 Tax=Ancylostoma ceylanicum TaxID=53326 RepID=A0A016S8R4_9BILA|nr:hypothetical protein Y032_0269g814 [Ancylostoma ceylanicum]